MKRRRRRWDLYSLIVGLAVTIAVALAAGLGWLDRFELWLFDARVRYANSIPEHPDITCIGIDDRSLWTVGRWPWPRDVQAALISVPAELGARAIVLDLSFVEPEVVRIDVPRNADVFPPLLPAPDQPARRIYPDDQLRRAIERAGNVYLAVHYDPGEWDRTLTFRRIVDALRDGPLAAAELSERLYVPADLAERLLPAARVALTLEQHPTRTQEEIRAELGLSVEEIRPLFERCRQFILRQLVRQRLAENPQWADAPYQPGPDGQLPVQRIYRELAGRPLRDMDNFAEALLPAFRDVINYAQTLRRPIFDQGQAPPIIGETDALVPAINDPAAAARRCGFVHVHHDADGVIRRAGLLARYEGRVLGQLAFSVAFDLLGLSAGRIEIRPGRMTLNIPGPPPRTLDIQLDEKMRTVIPWVPQTDWSKQFGGHLPADALWQVHDRRRQIAENLASVRAERTELLGSSLFAAGPEFARLIGERDELEQKRPVVAYRGRPEELESIDRALAEVEQQLRSLEERLVAGKRAELERARADSAPSSLINNLEFALAQFDKHEQLAARVREVNARLQAEVDGVLAELRPRIADKVCLIGYTATSLADMTPIPTHARAPGMMMHANLLNSLLTGRMVYWAPPWLNALLTLVIGALCAAFSAGLAPRPALAVVLSLCLVYVVAAGWAAFYFATFWIALAPVLAAALFAYFGVAVYRYIFVDRERRELATALGQYTSREIARQVAEDPELCRRAEMREVTAMFTDLRGFTSIAERIGAERTQRVLNVALGRFSEVLVGHEGIVNKFIGDGIFAFWNPVIHPRADHSLLACESALDLLEELHRLRAEHAPRDGVFAELMLRIGVATGNAIVGPCGSEQKFDYTCIGDSVNVASRLESANRFYGSNILVNAATREAAADRFVFRSLGGVRVKGKQMAVQIFELVGRRGQVAPELEQYAEEFGRAASLFQLRRWAEARQVFEACLGVRPDDAATALFLAAIARYEAEPPAEDWSGALELVEK